MIRFFLFAFFTCWIYASQAQGVIAEEADKSLQKIWEKSINAFKDRDYGKCRKFLDQALKEEPLFVDALLLSGDVYAISGDIDRAVGDFEKGLNLEPGYLVAGWYRLSKILSKAERFEEAIVPMQQYEKRCIGEKKLRAQKELKTLQFTADLRANPVPFNPKNLGDGVNSEDSEYLPSFSVDGQTLVFTRRLGGANEDFFISSKEGDTWGKAVPVPNVNTIQNEGAQHLTYDSEMLLYTACNRTRGYGSCDLWMATHRGNSWSMGEMLPGDINSKDWDSQPCMTADGSTIYFTSNRPGGYGGMDIWISARQADGSWGPAVNAGPVINTAGKDQSPFIHPDGSTLYFTSSGHQGLGGTDLFLARRGLDGKWNTPQNLGWPINTSSNEGSLVVSADATTAFYASDREDSRGLLDIYSFELPESLRPVPVNYLRARVIHALTEAPLSAAVELINLGDGTVLVNDVSDSRDGSFMVCLPAERNYMLNVSKKGFLFHSENFAPTRGSVHDPFELTIKLLPVSDGAEVTLKNVFFETASAALDPVSETELNRLTTLLLDYPLLVIQINGHTDSDGDELYNQELSENRAKVVYQYLIDKGVDVNRLSFAGYGESNPVADNETAQGKAKNRRTTFTVLSTTGK